MDLEKAEGGNIMEQGGETETTTRRMGQKDREWGDKTEKKEF